jgi:hypothetical protein
MKKKYWYVWLPTLGSINACNAPLLRPVARRVYVVSLQMQEFGRWWDLADSWHQLSLFRVCCMAFESRVYCQNQLVSNSTDNSECLCGISRCAYLCEPKTQSHSIMY